MEGKKAFKPNVAVLEVVTHLDLMQALKRDAHGKSWRVRSLAKYLGITEGTLQKMLWCQEIPKEFTPHTAERLQHVTGKTVDELFPAIMHRKNYAEMVVNRATLLQKRVQTLLSLQQVPDGASVDDIEHSICIQQFWRVFYDACEDLLRPDHAVVVKLLWPCVGSNIEEVARITRKTPGQVLTIQRRSLNRLFQDPMVKRCLRDAA